VDRVDENAPSGYFPSTGGMLPNMLAAVDAPLPPFAFHAAPLTRTQRHRLYGSSWRPGCPVALNGLRHVRLS
jgi:hypothetical protein